MNRNEMEAFIKNYIRVYLLRTREERNLSQEKMAELLKMSWNLAVIRLHFFLFYLGLKNIRRILLLK